MFDQKYKTVSLIAKVVGKNSYELYFIDIFAENIFKISKNSILQKNIKTWFA